MRNVPDFVDVILGHFRLPFLKTWDVTWGYIKRNVVMWRLILGDKWWAGYYKPNNETHSCSHCCSGKRRSIIYPEALLIQHAMCMRHIVIYGLSGCTILTYLLTPWCRVLLEKLTGLQPVKKFPAFYGTRRFITVLTSVSQLSLSWANPIQST